MNKIFYSLIISTLFLLASCDNRECINPKNKVLGKSTEQLLGDAKNRSWWVYVEENTSLRDSVYLQNFLQKIERFRENEACDDKEVISFELIGQGILCDKASVRIEALSSIDAATFADSLGSDLFNFTFYKNKNDKYENDNWISYEILPTFSVLGIDYEDVIKVTQKGFDLNGVANAAQMQVRYFAPKVGLIRLENVPDANFPDNSVYNLEKYETH